jgi:hypothetical protein
MSELRESLLLEIEAANGRFKWAVDKVREEGPSTRLNWILANTLIELRILNVRLSET